MNALIVFSISIIIATLLFLIYKGVIFRTRSNLAIKHTSRALKVMAVMLVVVITVNSFFSDSFLYVINGGWQHETYFKSSDYLQTAFRWMQAVSYIVLPVALFGKGRIYKNIALLFCLPIAVAYTVMYPATMSYYLTVPVFSHGYVVAPVVRHLVLSLELVLSVSLPLGILAQGHVPKLKSPKLLLALAFLPVLLAVSMPPYVPQSVYGLLLINLPDVQFQWIGITVLITLALILVFRFKDRQTRLELCWVLTLALFINYNYTFIRGLTIRSVPLQLCNIASYFMLLAMVIKKPSFFYFVFLANVTGTIIAMIIPEAAEPKITSFHTVRFMWQHSLVMIAPCVTMGLRIFPRLGGRSMVHSLIGFSSYWTFCLFFGAYVNAHPEIFNMDVNLFYLFETDVITYIAPWSVPFQKPVEVFGLLLRPAVQVMILVVFYALTCLLFLIVTHLYRFEDDHLLLRNKLLEIIENKTGKRLPLPREYKE